MTTKKLPHEWSKESLLLKTQRYAETMLSHDQNDWQYGFWSALVLEMLARAALSNVSPTLIASGKEWENIYYALGNQPNVPKFKPKSDETSKIFVKISSIFPDFTKEMLDFTSQHLDRRNSEVHSGALPFDGLGTSVWLPLFYETCECLLKTMGLTLESLFGKAESLVAQKLITAQKDTAAKSVQKLIAAQKTVWDDKDKAEKATLSKQAELIATKHAGHRVSCPACGSTALLHGTPAAAAIVKVEDGTVIEKQAMLPANFECVACGLKISGFSKLVACGLGDTFTATSHYDPAEYYGIDIHDEWEGYEDDNNEP